MSEPVKRLLELELEQTDRFMEFLENRSAPVPANREVLIGVLKQRRLLSLDLFIWTLDRMICALECDQAREVAMGILREEYAQANHRYAFFLELRRLNVSRRVLIESRPTETTRSVMDQIVAMVHDLEAGGDLQRLIFLRFFAERLPGHEFSFLCKRLEQVELLSRAESRFLHPHYQFDITGEGGASHADQYLESITLLLDGADALAKATTILNRSVEIRCDFYRQFAYL